MLALVDLIDIDGNEVTVNPRHVVGLRAVKGAQTSSTRLTLSVGDVIVIDAPPSEVKRRLRGAAA